MSDVERKCFVYPPPWWKGVITTDVVALITRGQNPLHHRWRRMRASNLQTASTSPQMVKMQASNPLTASTSTDGAGCRLELICYLYVTTSSQMLEGLLGFADFTFEFEHIVNWKIQRQITDVLIFEVKV